MTDKLDCVMVIACEHIKASACDGRLVKVSLFHTMFFTVLLYYPCFCMGNKESMMPSE